MTWGEVFEDAVLTAVTIEGCLIRLRPPERVLLAMVFQIYKPGDYDGPWPPTYADVGRYVGLKFSNQPMSEATVRYRRTEILAYLRGSRGPLRKMNVKSPKTTESASDLPEDRLTRESTLAPPDMEISLYERTLLPRYLDVIEGMATKLSNRDPDLFEDLRQTGMIALWKLDVTKARKNADAYIRQVLRNKMIEHLRQMRPGDYKSLQLMLDDGVQVVRDGSTGEATFVDRMAGRRNYLEDDVDD